MNRQKVVQRTLIAFVLLCIGTGIFIFTQTPNPFTIGGTPGGTVTHLQDGTKFSENLGKAESTDPWETWIQDQADMWVKVSADQLRSGKSGWTEASLRESIVASLRKNMEEIKEKNDGTLPPVDDNPITLGIRWRSTGKKYFGPQTPEALMEAFHTIYTRGNYSSADNRYPPAEFLQKLLDRGITIINYNEYAGYMNARVSAIVLEKDPIALDMASGQHGIPASNLVALQAAVIEAKIARKQRSSLASRADENIKGGAHYGEHFLPFYSNRKTTYVVRNNHDEDFSAKFLGTSLTETQKFNLIFRGVEPEEIDIVYIDKDGYRLEAKPPPVNRKEVIEMMSKGETPPLEEWENKEAPVPQDFDEFLPSELHPDTTAKQAASAVQAEQERFQQMLRQFDEFSNMSNAEFESEIERLLTPQLPELPSNKNIQQEILEQVALKQVTPERFEKALETLNQYGPEEGLRKIATDDPELAKYFLNQQKQGARTHSHPPNANNHRLRKLE